MARTSAKAKKPPRKESENKSTENNASKEILEGNKSEANINEASIEKHNVGNENFNNKVDKIIGYQESGGKIQYLVRWKGFKEEKDTWENESALKSCGEFISSFKKRNMESCSRKNKDCVKIEKSKLKIGIEKSQRYRYLSEGKTNKKKRKNKTGKRAKSSTRKKIKKETKPAEKECIDSENSEESDNDSTDGINYEVEKIIEMRVKKNGSREFLIRWKGYNPGQDTWEPETHLNCQDMITRFIEQISQASKNTTTALTVSKDSD